MSFGRIHFIVCTSQVVLKKIKLNEENTKKNNKNMRNGQNKTI